MLSRALLMPRREVMPSFLKTFRKWYSTVCLLMNSRAAILGVSFVELGDINARGLPITWRTCSTPRRDRAARRSRWYPVTGKTVWTFQEPKHRVMRIRCAITTARAWPIPASTGGRRDPGHDAGILHALDAKTGEPLPNWYRAGARLPEVGVDRHARLPYRGSATLADETPLPSGQRPAALARLHHHLFSPPIVNDVLVIGNSAEQGATTRRASRRWRLLSRLRRAHRQVPLEVPRDRCWLIRS